MLAYRGQAFTASPPHKGLIYKYYLTSPEGARGDKNTKPRVEWPERRKAPRGAKKGLYGGVNPLCLFCSFLVLFIVLFA